MKYKIVIRTRASLFRFERMRNKEFILCGLRVKGKKVKGCKNILGKFKGCKNMQEKIGDDKIFGRSPEKSPTGLKNDRPVR